MRIDQRCGPLGVGQVLLTEVVQSLAVATGAAERHGGLESGGDQHADLRTLVLDQRVGPQRGGVTNRVDLGQDRLEFEAQNLVGLAQRLIEAKCQVVVGGERLGLDVLAIPDHKTIGERATDVNGYASHFYSLMGWRQPPDSSAGNLAVQRSLRRSSGEADQCR